MSIKKVDNQPINAPSGAGGVVWSTTFSGLSGDPSVDSLFVKTISASLPAGAYATTAHSNINAEVEVANGNAIEGSITVTSGEPVTSYAYLPGLTSVTFSAPGGWVARTSGFSTLQAIDNIAYGNGTYLITGDVTYKSTNGITWTVVSTGVSNNPYAGTFGDGYFLVGGDVAIGYSTNAVTWTTIANSTIGLNQLYVAMIGNGKYFVAGQSGAAAYSSNRTSWTSSTPFGGGAGTINAGKFLNGTFFLGYTSIVKTSTDAITWTTRSALFGAANVNDFAYGNGIYIAVGDSAAIRTSTDMVTWTTQTAAIPGQTISAVTYGYGRFVASGGSSGKVQTSTDGVTWTSQTSNFGNSNVNALNYGGGLFIAGGNAGKLSTLQPVNASVSIYSIPTV